MTAALSLVADIGATNARFGLLDDQGRIVYSQILPCAGYPTLELAAAAYLDAAAPDARPRRGALAIAGPVTGDVIVMTNHPWTFSVTATCAALGLDRWRWSMISPPSPWRCRCWPRPTAGRSATGRRCRTR
jgi:glucokinase